MLHKLLCSDYRDFLNQIEPNSVDLILTDPLHSVTSQDNFKIDLTVLAKKSFRVIRAGGTILVWYDIWDMRRLRAALEAAGFEMIRLIIWQKTNPAPLNPYTTYLENSQEFAIVGVKQGSKPTFNSNYDNGLYEYPMAHNHTGKICHTQKPDKLLAELIDIHSNTGDLIVDPFLGSGTTAVAALKHGCRFAGCDLNSDCVTAVMNHLTSSNLI